MIAHSPLLKSLIKPVWVKHSQISEKGCAVVQAMFWETNSAFSTPRGRRQLFRSMTAHPPNININGNKSAARGAMDSDQRVKRKELLKTSEIPSWFHHIVKHETVLSRRFEFPVGFCAGQTRQVLIYTVLIVRIATIVLNSIGCFEWIDSWRGLQECGICWQHRGSNLFLTKKVFYKLIKMLRDRCDLRPTRKVVSN